LGAVLEEPNGQGRLKASYKLEVMTKKEQMIMDGLGISDGSVYTNETSGKGRRLNIFTDFMPRFIINLRQDDRFFSSI
jgi:hypothetical protein